MHEFPKPSGRRVRSPWLWVVAGTLVAAVIGTSALHFATASCAASLGGPPPLGSVTQGQAYFYDPGEGPGACSLGPLPANGLYVSLAEPQYAGGAACGSYVDITGPSGKVTAEVVDSCPGCTDGGIDLSEAAFAKVANPAQGMAEVSYVQARDPKLPGPLALRVAQSSTSGWLAVQVLNAGNPLASVAVAPWNSPPGTGWHSLALSPDDYWTDAAGAGPGPFRVRITDIFGHQVVARGIRLHPGTLQQTSLLMYTKPAAPPANPSSSTASASAHRSTPSQSASPSRLASPGRSASPAAHC
jgi:expansin (peptidoglycan-binding protein)